MACEIFGSVSVSLKIVHDCLDCVLLCTFQVVKNVTACDNQNVFGSWRWRKRNVAQLEPGGRLAKILEGQALLLFEIPDYHCEVDSLGDIGQGHKLLGFFVGVEVDSSEFGGGILC